MTVNHRLLHTSASSSRQMMRGTSLVEVVLALAFSAVFSGIVYSFCQSSLRSVETQLVRSDAQETAYLALQQLCADVRQAGYTAADPIAGLTSASATQLEVCADLNGDGDFADSNEIIAYAADTARGTLTRASGGAPPQPVADHLVAGSLQFTYFDATGAMLSAGGGGLDALQRAAVRRIDVAFEIAVPSRDARLQAATRIAVGTSIALRNAPPS